MPLLPLWSLLLQWLWRHSSHRVAEDVNCLFQAKPLPDTVMIWKEKSLIKLFETDVFVVADRFLHNKNFFFTPRIMLALFLFCRIEGFFLSCRRFLASSAHQTCSAHSRDKPRHVVHNLVALKAELNPICRLYPAAAKRRGQVWFNFRTSASWDASQQHWCREKGWWINRYPGNSRE